MPQTPDRKPGPSVEEELQLESQGSDPTIQGAQRFTGAGFRFRDGSGVFNPRHVRLALAGTLVGERNRINLIAGAGIAFLAQDDALNDEIDLTIATSAAAQFASAESLGRSTTTSNAYQNKVSLAVPFTMDGTYLVMWQAAVDCPDNRSVLVQLKEEPGSSAINQRTEFAYSTSTTLIHGVGGFALRTWTNQVGVIYRVQYASEQNTKLVAIRDARIALWKVG